MKKATLETIRTVLTDNRQTIEGLTDEQIDAIVSELDADINKGAAEKAARTEAYEGIHSLIVDNLSETPVTCADLFGEIEAEITAKGMTRYNVQYALNNLWQDEIVKISGKPNTYRRAV